MRSPALFKIGFLAALPLIPAAALPHANANSGPGSSWTVNQLASHIAASNPELAFYRAEIAAARAGRRVAGQWPNPELTAELGHKQVWERGGGRSLGDGAAWSVSVAQPFEWPGRLALRKAIASREIEIAELGLAQFERALGAQARRWAYAALAAGAQAEAAGDVAERFRSLLEVLVQRETSGVTPLLDQRIIEANLLTLQRRATQSAQEQQAALLQLNQLRGAPASEALALIGSIPAPTNAPPLELLLAMAATNNFDIRMRQLELTRQGFAVRLARNERYPRVSLAPFYASEKGADEERTAGLGVSIPLPLWNQNQGAIDAAEARASQAETSLLVVAKKVEREVTENAMALRAKIQEMGRWRPGTEQYFREASELADRHYRLGAVPVTTYLEMQSRYLEALEALLATRRETLENWSELELLVGQSLPNPPAN